MLVIYRTVIKVISQIVANSIFMSHHNTTVFILLVLPLGQVIFCGQRFSVYPFNLSADKSEVR